MNILLERIDSAARRATEVRERTGRTGAAAGRPILRLPVCQNRFERLALDVERAGTVCRGCQHELASGCPNTTAWSLDGTGGVKPVCEADALVYCRHYDCGCDLCANFLDGTPMPMAGRG